MHMPPEPPENDSTGHLPPDPDDRASAIDPQNWPEVEKLYLEHQDTARRAAAWFLRGHAADADEVAHVAMIKAGRTIETLRDPRKTRQWLLAIVRNAACDHLRTQKRRWARHRPMESFDDPALASFVASRTVTPQQAALLIDAMRFVDSLPGKQRDAFLLANYFGLDRDEIAEILGCKAATVTTHLRRAAAKAAKVFPAEKEISHTARTHLGRSTS